MMARYKLYLDPLSPKKTQKQSVVRVAEKDTLWQNFLDPRLGRHRKQL